MGLVDLICLGLLDVAQEAKFTKYHPAQFQLILFLLIYFLFCKGISIWFCEKSNLFL